MKEKHLIDILKFGLVGVSTAAIYFLVMCFADLILGVSYTWSISTAYFLSTIFHFLANRSFTFSVTHDRYDDQIVRYIVVCLINYMITLVVVKLCVELFGFSHYIGVCVSVLFTVFSGYGLGRYWVFNIKKEMM